MPSKLSGTGHCPSLKSTLWTLPNEVLVMPFKWLCKLAPIKCQDSDSCEAIDQNNRFLGKWFQESGRLREDPKYLLFLTKDSDSSGSALQSAGSSRSWQRIIGTVIEINLVSGKWPFISRIWTNWIQLHAGWWSSLLNWWTLALIWLGKSPLIKWAGLMNLSPTLLAI